MKKFNIALLGGMAILCQTTLIGCVDNDYDLSDIDTTVQLSVNDLTVPINFDEIYLKNILKPADDSSIKQLDGEYAVVQSGTISSDVVKIDMQHIVAPHIEPSVENIYEGADIPGDIVVEPTEEVHSYSIVDINGDFLYEKSDIPAEILGIRRVGVDWTIAITVSITDPDNVFRSLKFTDVVISLPKGLTPSREPDRQRYDSSTGLYNLGDVTVEAGILEYTLSVPISEVDFTVWDSEDFSFLPGENGQEGKIHIAGNVGVKSGNAVVTVLTGSSHPSAVDFVLAPWLSDIDVKSFSGRLQYTFHHFSIPNINIDDLPDLLSDSETNIILNNPQLYVEVNNPVANYNLDLSSDLALTPFRNGRPGTVCALDAGESIDITHDKGVAGPYKFCISPSKPANYYQGWDGAQHVGCKSFANILSGDGIPTEIGVDCENARVMPGEVDDFKLGTDIGKIDGSYTVYCPLALDAGSRVVYSDNVDGWNDDTVDRIVISSLTVTTTVTNDLPFDIVLSGYPLSIDPNDADKAVQSVDPVTGKPVTITEVSIAAGATTEVTLTTNGRVVHLDGIHFVARASVEKSGNVLSPDTAIRLSSLRAKVSGTYTDTL